MIPTEAAYIGVDPGASGAIACLPATADPGFLKLKNATPHDVCAYLAQLADRFVCFAYLERVHAMPKQGVSSTFKFGQSFGMLEMGLVCSAIPFELVTPQKWQKSMGCLSRGDKNVTKKKAQDLFPRLKVTHANADALLLAEFARRSNLVQTGDTPR